MDCGPTRRTTATGPPTAAKRPEELGLVGRIDRLIEPSPRGNDIDYIPFDPSAPATLYLAAFEHQKADLFILKIKRLNRQGVCPLLRQESLRHKLPGREPPPSRL